MAQTNAKTYLELNKEGLLKVMGQIANHGIVIQGREEAIKHLKDCVRWRRGIQRIPLTDQEASKLLRQVT